MRIFEDKNFIKKSLITLAVGIVVSVTELFVLGFFDVETLPEKYKILSDVFYIPGALMLCIGGLLWVSTTGFFDIFAFGFKKLYERITLSRENEFQKFYDYKETKVEKGRMKGFSFLFCTGGVFIFVAIIFDLLFNFID